MPDPQEITLAGRIERITYHNRDNHFTIARMRTDENRRTITIKGTMPDPKVGESVEVRGRWESHARYGQQLHFSAFTPTLPATVDGIRTYLMSGFIKGVGPRLVERIVGRFGPDTLTIIEEAPDRLTEVDGIGRKTARRIGEAWQSHHAARQLMRFLETNGVDVAHTARLLRAYGNDAVEVLCNDPYRVVEDIPRVGFAIADAIVRNADTPVDELDRAKACILHLVEQAVDQGHAYVSREQLMQACGGGFEIAPDTGSEALSALIDGEELVAMDADTDPAPLVFPRRLYDAETAIARRIAAMQTVPVAEPPPDSGQITRAVLDRLAITLSTEQQAILGDILAHKVSVITGGPGTGKTTLIRSITAVLEGLRRRVLLVAPTGRAARRLAEVTGRQAATLHKALGYNLADGLFERNEDDPLDADAVIVDEASMVDTLLMDHLVRAVPMTASLIMVGDVFQLPSVGPGNVLADLIASKAVVTFALTEIFRQARESLIIVNAHRVRQGTPPILPPPGEQDDDTDFHFIEKGDPQRVADTILDLCARRIPDHFGLDPIRDIQVLTPMHRGIVGTLNLNRQLQQALNPGGDHIEVMGNRFQCGDKVMHLRNNYRKEVFNGDIGVMAAIDPDEGRVTVDFDGRMVPYEILELEQLGLAYAISVHKSQGSEYPAVVMPLLTQHYIMLQRNLLYTALTRGKQLVVVVGTAKALRVALENDRPRQRRSMLAQRLAALTGGGWV